MSKIFNATEEIAALADFDKIRYDQDRINLLVRVWHFLLLFLDQKFKGLNYFQLMFLMPVASFGFNFCEFPFPSFYTSLVGVRYILNQWFLTF